MAPGNLLALMWPAISLVTWHCHIVLVMVVVCVGGQMRVAAIDGGERG